MGQNDVVAYKNRSGTEVFSVDQDGNVTAAGVISTTGTDDFGSAGIKADVVAESTAAAGVTVDGLRVKDAAITPVAGGSAWADLSNCASGEGDIALRDNVADAMSVREAANLYLTFVTTNSSESIKLGKPLSVTAGMSAWVDLSAAATGEADIIVGDNLADAFTIREGATAYLTFVTTNSGEKIQVFKTLDVDAASIDASTQATTLSVIDNNASAFSLKEAANTYLELVTTNGSESVAIGQRLTTTDGVPSGTARVVGGRHSAATADSTTISGGAGDQAFDVTSTIPANTLKAGSKLRVRVQLKAVAQNGSDTFQAKLTVGGTALVATSAVDIGANDRAILVLEGTVRAAPGASVAFAYGGHAAWSTGGSAPSYAGGNTNLATDGAIVVGATIAYGSSNSGNQALLEALDVEII